MLASSASLRGLRRRVSRRCIWWILSQETCAALAQRRGSSCFAVWSWSSVLGALLCLPACVTKEVAYLAVQAPAVIRLIGSEGQSEEYVLGARVALLPLAERGAAGVVRHFSAAPQPCP